MSGQTAGPARPEDRLSPAGLGPGQRSALTILVLVLALLLGTFWGWRALTAPLPATTSAICVDRTVEAGAPVRPAGVTVSVLNAGSRGGLASTTLNSLTAAGFARGEDGNAPRDSGVEVAQIWADDADDPAVRLLRTYIDGPVPVRDVPNDEAGITLVVGNGFPGVVEGREQVRADEVTLVCGPPELAEPAVE